MQSLVQYEEDSQMPSPEPMDVDIAARADLEAKLKVPRAPYVNVPYPRGLKFESINYEFRFAAVMCKWGHLQRKNQYLVFKSGISSRSISMLSYSLGSTGALENHLGGEPLEFGDPDL